MKKLVNSSVASFALALFISLLAGCGRDDGPTGTGATASLSWEPVTHATEIAYTVHYGRQSSGAPGACNYDNAIDVSEPSAFITGLEFNTQYYFAVSARTLEGERSSCSNEASKLTPDLPPVQIGDPPVTLSPASGKCDIKCHIGRKESEKTS